jgi:hypothetical protein
MLDACHLWCRLQRAFNGLRPAVGATWLWFVGRLLVVAGFGLRSAVGVQRTQRVGGSGGVGMGLRPGGVGG